MESQYTCAYWQDTGILSSTKRDGLLDNEAAMVFSRTIMGGAIDYSCQKDHQRIGRCSSGKIRYVTAGRLKHGKDGWVPFTPQTEGEGK